MTASPEKTWAIVVGVETYAVGSGWNLNGPANDACQFVRWLRARSVPDTQIELFVSALPENQPLVDQAGIPAIIPTHAAITTAITDELAKRSGDLLIFFWGGHGVIDAKNSRRLFCADAGESNLRHISLNSLLTTWRTDSIGYFPRQVGFIDACQNYMEYNRLASTIPEDVLPSGTPVPGIEQFFMLAASVGELATNLTQEKTGAYSQALLQELEKTNSDWPPDMADLNRRMMERFTSLRDAGHPDQTPSHLWFRDWKGGEGTIASFKRQSPAKPAAAIQLTNEQRDELVMALLELDAMANRQERESVIADLRREIKFNIEYSNKDRFHVDNLVKTAVKYPGGLQELIHTIKRFKGADETAWQNLETVLGKLNIPVS